MAYYCFLCNQTHEDSPTEEHFIPRSIGGPEYQWLPVCEISNTRSNQVFDNDARDILYWVRYQNTKALKRSGEALLSDGTLKRFNFSYYENLVPEVNAAFRYIYDIETNEHISHNHIYAIAFSVGLEAEERPIYHRGLAKISLGALIYLLKRQKVEDETIRQISSQPSVDAMRCFALDLPWSGETMAMGFRCGRSDVLGRLQHACKNPQVCNHVIKISFQDGSLIHIEGMLYSQYGWVLDLSNQVFVEEIEERELRLENAIVHMNAPGNLRDMTGSSDVICVVNPEYSGEKPNLPQHWRNSS